MKEAWFKFLWNVGYFIGRYIIAPIKIVKEKYLTNKNKSDII